MPGQKTTVVSRVGRVGRAGEITIFLLQSFLQVV
jgi:hypothetical protein